MEEKDIDQQIEELNKILVKMTKKLCFSLFGFGYISLNKIQLCSDKHFSFKYRSIS